MPRPGIGLPGIALASLLVCPLLACSALSESHAPLPTPTPSATAAAGTVPWVENLAFSGDLTGQLTSIVASAPGQQSECTGRNSSGGGRWDSAIYGQVGQAILGVVVTATPYRGPGSYSAAAATVQVHSIDNQRVWLSRGSDPVTFTVAADETSGSIDAVLTNQVDNRSKLRVTGTWSCGR